MKILHVLDRSLPNISGYSQRSASILKFQKALGLSVLAVTSPNQESASEREDIEGISYYRTPVPAGWRKTNPWLKSAVTIAALKRKIEEVVRAERVDMIHAHSPVLCGMPALKVGKKYGIPVVYEVRALWEDAAVDQRRTSVGSLRYRLSRHYETRLLKGADSIIVICDGLKDEVLSRGIPGSKVHIVPNGVDTDYFIPQPKDTELAGRYGLDGSVTFGFIGSFFAFEGLELFVKAALRLLEKDKRVKIMMVGSGESGKKVADLIKGSKEERNFILTGKVPHDQVKNYYSIADVMVYPRLKHRLTDLVTPLKPLEAMSMSKAVIASNVGGLRELVEEGRTGMLFEAGDADALAEKMAALAKDGTMRLTLGKNARTSVEKKRGWDEIANRYLPIYAGLAGRKGRTP